MNTLILINDLTNIYINASSYYLITLWRELNKYNNLIEKYISIDLYKKWNIELNKLHNEWIYGNGQYTENIRIDCIIILKKIIDFLLFTI